MDLARAKAMALQMTVALQAQVEKFEREGRPGSSLGRAFAAKAGLNDAEAEVMSRVAARMKERVAPLDQRARAIIQAARQKFPGGRLQPGAVPPPPPAELADLQRQRDAVVAQAVRDLEQELGPAGLAKLESHLNQTMLQKKPPSLTIAGPKDIGPPGQTARPASSRQEATR